MTTKQKLITADELLRLPRGEGRRYELIRGVVVDKMPPGDKHGEAVSRIDTLLSNYSDSNDYGGVRAGEPGYLLERDPDTVRAPDVAWFSPDRVPEEVQGYPELAPDLAVEVKSPRQLQPRNGFQGRHVAQLRLPPSVGRRPGDSRPSRSTAPAHSQHKP